jgi:hypothetical protein
MTTNPTPRALVPVTPTRYDIAQMLIDDLRARITVPLLTDRIRNDRSLGLTVEGDNG